ncbi:MAG: hypothetical protein ACKPHW_07180, partial [Microcystis panniformis]
HLICLETADLLASWNANKNSEMALLSLVYLICGDEIITPDKIALFISSSPTAQTELPTQGDYLTKNQSHKLTPTNF